MVAVAVVGLSGPVSLEREELAAKIEVESDEEVLDGIELKLARADSKSLLVRQVDKLELLYKKGVDDEVYQV